MHAAVACCLQLAVLRRSKQTSPFSGENQSGDLAVRSVDRFRVRRPQELAQLTLYTVRPLNEFGIVHVGFRDYLGNNLKRTTARLLLGSLDRSV